MTPATSSDRVRKRTTRPRQSKPKSKSKTTPIECPICLSLTKPAQTVKLATCNCVYCKSCLSEAFRVGLTAANFPARCCGSPIDVVAHEKHLKPSLRRAYQSKAEEKQSNAPIYCANTSCGEYIMESAHKDKFATCGKCHVKTCTECKVLKENHLGVHLLCPDSTEELRDLSQRQGWQRCPRCFCIVERVSGCDEIRCICKAYFCYSCGKLTGASTRDVAEKCTCHNPVILNMRQVQNVGAITHADDEDDLPTLEALLPPRRDVSS